MNSASRSPPNLRPIRLAHIGFAAIASVSGLLTSFSARSEELCVCLSDIAAAQDAVGKVMNGGNCGNSPETSGVRNVFLSLADSRRQNLCKREGKYFRPNAGDYVVFRNSTADVWVHVSDWNGRVDSDGCENANTTHAREMVSNLFSPSNLQCGFPATNPQKYSQYGDIHVFEYRQSPDDPGLLPGFSVGNKSSGDFGAFKEALTEYGNAKTAELNNRAQSVADYRKQKQSGSSTAPDNATAPSSGRANQPNSDQGGKDSKSFGGGTGGPFPSGGPEWLGRAIMIAAQNFGAREYLQYGLTALLIVAPDVFEKMANFTNSLTESLNNPDLDRAFKLVDDAVALGKAITQIESAFGENFADAMRTTADAIKAMPPEMRQELEKSVGPQISRIADAFTAADAARLGNLIEKLNNIDDWKGLQSAILDQAKKQAIIAARATATHIVAQKMGVPDGVLGPDVADSILNGDLDKAGKATGRAIVGELGQKLGLSKDEAGMLLDPEGIKQLAILKTSDALRGLSSDIVHAVGVSQNDLAVVHEILNGRDVEATLERRILDGLPENVRRLTEATRAGDTSAREAALRALAQEQLSASLPPSIAKALTDGEDFQSTASALLVVEIKAALAGVPDAENRIASASSLDELIAKIQNYPLRSEAVTGLQNRFGSDTRELIADLYAVGTGPSQTTSIDNLREAAIARARQLVPHAREFEAAADLSLSAAFRLSLRLAPERDGTLRDRVARSVSFVKIIDEMRHASDTEIDDFLAKFGGPGSAIAAAVRELRTQRSETALRKLALASLRAAEVADVRAEEDAALRHLKLAIYGTPALVLTEFGSEILSASSVSDALGVVRKAPSAVADFLQQSSDDPILAQTLRDALQTGDFKVFASYDVFAIWRNQALSPLASGAAAAAVSAGGSRLEAVASTASLVGAAVNGDRSAIDNLIVGAVAAEKERAQSAILAQFKRDTETFGKLSDDCHLTEQTVAGLLSGGPRGDSNKLAQCVAEAIPKSIAGVGDDTPSLKEISQFAVASDALQALFEPIIRRLSDRQRKLFTALILGVHQRDFCEFVQLADRCSARDVDSAVRLLRSELDTLGFTPVALGLNEVEFSHFFDIDSPFGAEKFLDVLVCKRLGSLVDHCRWKTAVRDVSIATEDALTSQSGPVAAAAILSGNSADLVDGTATSLGVQVHEAEQRLGLPKADGNQNLPEATATRSPGDAVFGGITRIGQALASPDIAVPAEVSMSSCRAFQFQRRSALVKKCELLGIEASDGSQSASACLSELMPTPGSLGTECHP